VRTLWRHARGFPQN